MERGLPLFATIPQKTHGGGSQLFSAAQDASGALHFGSLRGVLTYDGAWWQITELPNESAVFSVAAGRGPEIAVGAYQEMGYVTRDPHGTLVYRSLVPQLPADFREVGDVRSVCATAGGFVFVGERAVFAWNGGAPRVLADLRGTQNPPSRCATAGGATYLYNGTGLQRIGSPLTLLRGKRVESVIELDATRAIASVPGEGLLRIDGDAATPFAPEASQWLRGKSVIRGAHAGARIVIGTRQHGVLLLTPDGAIEQHLGDAAGLPGDVLGGVLTDREGAVWLAYHGPIVRLDLSAPVSLLDERIGLYGTSTAIVRFAGRVHIATSHGLFRIDDGRAVHIDGVPSPVWTAMLLGDELLAGTDDGVFLIDARGSARRIAGTESVVAYDALRSKADPSRVWIAARKGIGTLRRDGGSWRFDGLIDGTPRYTRTLVERDGALWAGSIFDGAVRLDSRGRVVETFGSDEVDVSEVGGRITVIRENRFFIPDWSAALQPGRLVPDPRLRHVRGNFFRVAEDARGNLWSNATPPQFIARRADGSYAEPVPLVSIDAANIQVVQADADGTIWFAGDEALHRYDASARTVVHPQPRPLIRRVVAADGKPVSAPLPYSFRRLRIEFAPLSYQPGILYQYRLGSDEAWSAWTAEPSIDYTNLDEGDHIVHLRTRSAAGVMSPEATWRFTVLAPWYRSRPVLLLWIVAAAAVITAIVRLRTRALRKQADRLRMLVAERTEELEQANAHLERLSLLDELTGIANRRYFQRALVEDWNSALADRRPLALVIVDLDHFKQLNDQHGHPAGDTALVQAARFLAREIRRSGELQHRASDIVARIGGEEFAILLASTNEDEAVLQAERFRAGIAAMQLDAGSLTASCGVAAMVPFDVEGWSALVESADRALYAAKAAGRNCVRRASETPGAALAV